MNALRRLVAPSLIAPLAALLIAAALVSLTTPRFLDMQNMLNISLQVSIVAIMAIGSTFVILTGGIDLSPGSMMALLTMLMALFITQDQLPLALVIVLIVVIGAALGAANGVLVAYVRIPPFIVTLSMLSILRGWAFLYNDGSPIFSVSPLLDPLFYGAAFGVPLPLIYVLVSFAIAYVFLNYTMAGRAIYAVGGNEAAARFSGINVRRTRMLAYMIAGATAGLASVLMVARLNSGSPNYGTGMELQAIGAAVIGGASLAGGSGNILATLAGALTIVVVQNGLNLNAVPISWQLITLGAIIACAVGLDSWRTQIAGLVGRRFGGPRRAVAPIVDTGASRKPEGDKRQD